MVQKNVLIPSHLILPMPKSRSLRPVVFGTKPTILEPWSAIWKILSNVKFSHGIRRPTGASSLVRLGYHPRLVGGISSRPEVPHADLLMENLVHYSSIANQPYPLNVRLEMPLISQGPPPVASPFSSILFDEGQKLYQKVKKCLRNKQSFDTLSFAS